PWKWLERQVVQFVRTLKSKLPAGGDSIARGNLALRFLAAGFLEVPPEFGDLLQKGAWAAPGSSMFDLRVTFDQIQCFAELTWNDPNKSLVATGRVRVTGSDQLTWELETGGRREPSITSHRRNSIRAALGAWLKRFPTNRSSFSAFHIKSQPGS